MSTATVIAQDKPAQACEQWPASRVGRELTDAERERHIRDCGRLAEMAMARYEETGCFDAIGEARRWAMLQAEAINSRSPAQIARMEAERGLA